MYLMGPAEVPLKVILPRETLLTDLTHEHMSIWDMCHPVPVEASLIMEILVTVRMGGNDGGVPLRGRVFACVCRITTDSGSPYRRY